MDIGNDYIPQLIIDEGYVVIGIEALSMSFNLLVLCSAANGIVMNLTCFVENFSIEFTS